MLRQMARNKSKTVTLVGAGNLAHALAELLPSAGYEIAEVVTRSATRRARAQGRRIGAPVRTIESALWLGEIVWLAVSDTAIRKLALSLTGQAEWEGKVVLHSSGALSSEELGPLRRRGAAVASVHPMMTFVPGETPKMSGVVWTVEGDASAVAEAKRIVGAMRGRSVPIDRRNKELYHAVGAFLSPLLVVHLETAASLALKAGLRRRDLAALMQPIVSRTLANYLVNVGTRAKTGKAFSGPLIRGDIETIERHLHALRVRPDARRLYAALVRSALHSDLPVKKRRLVSRLIALA